MLWQSSVPYPSQAGKAALAGSAEQVRSGRTTQRTATPESNAKAEAGATAANENRFDFTALDRIMPHPVYGMMYWVCALNPGEATWERVKPLIAEAYKAKAR